MRFGANPHIIVAPIATDHRWNERTKKNTSRPQNYNFENEIANFSRYTEPKSEQGGHNTTGQSCVAHTICKLIPDRRRERDREMERKIETEKTKKYVDRAETI